MLELKGVSKNYALKRVLDHVSLTFGPGLNLLVGPSGAGKTTLLRLLATAERPSKGSVTWKGGAGRRALRKTLGYAPQAVDLPDDLTCRPTTSWRGGGRGKGRLHADGICGAEN